jgi:hypothetical protein
MPDDHCPAMPQLTAVDGQFGTHTRRCLVWTGPAFRADAALVSGHHARGEVNCRNPSFVRELVTVDEVCPLAMRNKAVVLHSFDHDARCDSDLFCEFFYVAFSGKVT